jgi:hypothetical protein
MAPEQAGGTNDVDPRTDVWAAGATLHALLAGRPVHEGANAARLLVQAATTPARPLAEVAPRVPAAVCAVVDRALAFDRSARWPSARAMRDALAPALGADAPEEARARLSRAIRLRAPASPGEATSAPVALRDAQGDSTRPPTGGRPFPRAASPVLVAAVALAAATALAVTARGPLGARARGAAPAVPSATTRAPGPDPEPQGPPPPTSAAPPATPPPPAATAPRADVAPRATSSASRSCTPPFRIDPDGNKVFKRECI